MKKLVILSLLTVVANIDALWDTSSILAWLKGHDITHSDHTDQASDSKSTLISHDDLLEKEIQDTTVSDKAKYQAVLKEGIAWLKDRLDKIDSRYTFNCLMLSCSSDQKNEFRREMDALWDRIQQVQDLLEKSKGLYPTINWDLAQSLLGDKEQDPFVLSEYRK